MTVLHTWTFYIPLHKRKQAYPLMATFNFSWATISPFLAPADTACTVKSRVVREPTL